MENKNKVVSDNQSYKNDKIMRIVVGVISISISLAMIGYTVGTIFSLKKKKMESTKNMTKIEQTYDADEKELVKSR